jgi:hypothetical protein
MWTRPPHAVGNNRTCLLSAIAREEIKLRAEAVERGFALILDRSDIRYSWLRGQEKLQERDLIHVADYNLDLIMQLLIGARISCKVQELSSACLSGYSAC